MIIGVAGGKAFVDPYKRFADIIVPGGGDNPAAIDIIVTRIRKQRGQTE